MANENMVAQVARIVLRDAKTYTIGGRRWIKDVPGVVKGTEAIQSYQENGHFHVTVLKTGTSAPVTQEAKAETAAPMVPKQAAKPVLKKK